LIVNVFIAELQDLDEPHVGAFVLGAAGFVVVAVVGEGLPGH
jgi:hypothetical protein